MVEVAGLPPDLRRMEGDMPFQRRFWRMQRLAWVAMASLVLAALAGGFGGGGPLAEGVHRQAGVEIAWSRIQRLGAVTPMRVQLAGMTDGEAAALRFEPGFLAEWRLRGMLPAPRAADAGAAGLRLVPASAGDGGAAVVLRVEPIGWPGFRRLRVQAGGQAFDLFVLVWP